MDRKAAMQMMVDLATQFMTTVPKPVPNGWLDARQEVLTMLDEADDADKDPARKAKLAMDVAEPFHIEGMLALSTRHISKNTADALQGNSLDVIRYDHGDYGWLVYIPTDDTAWKHHILNADGGEFPSDLLDVMRHARRHGCCWLLLDADAAEIGELPTWDW